ncbi:MAG TPA: PepSY-associated TM helix domain-containing protein [Abditibacteriaceae bacterium]|jgi:uncharacterized iron-regulated membrane protein
MHRAPRLRTLLRKAVFFTHLWLGLLLGLYLVMAGVTGSLLVFGKQIDAQLSPHLHRVVPAGQIAPLSQMVTAVQRAHADKTIKRIRPSAHAEGSYEFSLSARAGEDWEAFVDPYRAHVLGARPYGKHFMGWTFDLHSNLLAGDRGRLLNGYAAVMAGLLLLSGLWLWWPSSKNFWKQLPSRLRVQRGASYRRLIHDLHNVAGIYTLPLLLLLTLTGAVFMFWEPVEAVLARLTGETAKPPTIKIVAHTRTPLPLDRLVQVAEATTPSTVISRIWLPTKPDKPLRVEQIAPGVSEEMRWVGYIRTEIDPYSGKVLHIDNARQAPLSTIIMQWTGPLHFGGWGGLWTKILYFVVGFVPVGLFVTGILKWREKRRGRARNRARHTAKQSEKETVGVRVL